MRDKRANAFLKRRRVTISAEQMHRAALGAMCAEVEEATQAGRSQNPKVDFGNEKTADTLAAWIINAVFSVRAEQRYGASGKRHRYTRNQDKRPYVAVGAKLTPRQGASHFRVHGFEALDGVCDLAVAGEGAFVWAVSDEAMDGDRVFTMLLGAVCRAPGEWTLVRRVLEGSAFVRDGRWYTSRRARTPGARTASARRDRR